MEEILYTPIGIVHSPFKTPEATPIQSKVSIGTEAVIEISPEYKEGLLDLGQFSHIKV